MSLYPAVDRLYYTKCVYVAYSKITMNNMWEKCNAGTRHLLLSVWMLLLDLQKFLKNQYSTII